MPTRPATFKPGTHAGSSDVRLTSRQRGYSTAWDKASATYRRLNPLCGYCQAGAFGDPRPRLCTRVDHLFPQRRWPGLFWEQRAWVGSCDECDASKQALEHGPVAGLDALAIRLGRPCLAELLRDNGLG